MRKAWLASLPPIKIKLAKQTGDGLDQRKSKFYDEKLTEAKGVAPQWISLHLSHGTHLKVVATQRNTVVSHAVMFKGHKGNACTQITSTARYRATLSPGRVR
jgi:hypothetical protein